MNEPAMLKQSALSGQTDLSRHSLISDKENARENQDIGKLLSVSCNKGTLALFVSMVYIHANHIAGNASCPSSLKQL